MKLHPLQDLIARVEAATGPDRELDGAIFAALGFTKDRPNICNSGSFRSPDGNLVPLSYEQPTASLDAALALVERVLPGAKVLMGLRQTPDTTPWARVGQWLVMDGADATATSLPLALLLALLRAVAAEAHEPAQLTRDA